MGNGIVNTKIEFRMSVYYWSIFLFLRFAVPIRSEYMYQEERLRFRRSIFLLYRKNFDKSSGMKTVVEQEKSLVSA